jgi:hypothetical protein
VGAAGWLLNLGFAGSVLEAPEPEAAAPPWVTLEDGAPRNVRGTLPGVRFLDLGGRNGVGIGRLEMPVARFLSWRAPGSATAGTAIDVSAGGTFLLRDGSDADKWIEIEVTAAYLPTGPAEAAVELSEQLNNAVASDDVSAAEAAAGDIETYELVLANRSNSEAPDVTLWLDGPTSRRIEISDDGIDWSAPLTEAAGLTVTLPAGGTVTMYLRRTIAAGHAVRAAQRTRLLYHAVLDAEEEHGELSGLFRVFNAAEYRAYHAEDAAPAARTAAWDTFASFPHTVDEALTDGDHRIAVTRFNGIWESPVGRVQRIVLVEDAEQVPPPAAPLNLKLTNIGAGVVRVQAAYAIGMDPPTVRADYWALFVWTVLPPEPPKENPDYTPAVTAARGYALLDYELPAQPDETPVTVRVHMQRGEGAEAVRSATYLEAFLEANAGESEPPRKVYEWATGD